MTQPFLLQIQADTISIIQSETTNSYVQVLYWAIAIILIALLMFYFDKRLNNRKKVSKDENKPDIPEGIDWIDDGINESEHPDNDGSNTPFPEPSPNDIDPLINTESEGLDNRPQSELLITERISEPEVIYNEPDSEPIKEEISQIQKRHTGYDNLNNYEQSFPWSYPLTIIPKKGTIVRSYSQGKFKRAGFKEASFKEVLSKYFDRDFEILGDIHLSTGIQTRPYEPDIALIDNKSGLNIRIDIEIDEPYAGITRKPTHLAAEDDIRDVFFKDRGWIVLRFTEHQVHTQEIQCIKHISSLIKELNPSFQINPGILNYSELHKEEQWDLLQAQKWEKEKYREEYLNHEFGIVNDEFEYTETSFSAQEIAEEKEVEVTLVIGEAEDNSNIGFNKSNINNRDERITFHPEPHLYFIDGIQANAVSNFVSSFFPEFDSVYWSEYKARKTGGDSAALRREWEEKGRIARDEGTFLHDQIERFYLGVDYNEPAEFYQFLEFYEQHKHLTPHRTEWRIFHETYMVAGTIDFISKNSDGTFDIYDWKRSKKVVNTFNGEPIMDNRYQSGIGPLKELSDTSYIRYCIQQNIYRYILEKKYDLEISNMYLVVMHPTLEKHYKVVVGDVDDNIIEQVLRY